MNVRTLLACLHFVIAVFIASPGSGVVQGQKHNPQNITFELKMQTLRPNGGYCNLILTPVDSSAPSSQTSVEIKFDNSKLRVYGNALQSGIDITTEALSSVQANVWVTVQINFDWDECELNFIEPKVLTVQMDSTGGVCDYDGVDAVHLRGYKNTSFGEYLQAWRRIDLVGSTGAVEHLHEITPVPMPYINWYDNPTKSQAPSFLGVIEINPSGHVYEGIAMRLLTFSSSTYGSSHRWLDMAIMVPYNNPGVGGDPHFVPFRAPPYSFHGQCDLVMLTSKEFASRLGIDIHIRTTRIDKRTLGYSYISGTAVKIGPDVLEIQQDGSSLMNGEDFLIEDKAVGKFAGPFDITKRYMGKLKVVLVYDLDLNNGRSIQIRFNRKNRMMFVDVHGRFPDDTVGLLGTPNNDKMIARDGKTDLRGAWNTMGEDWQVRMGEPKLFEVRDHYPQHPVGCLYHQSRNIKNSHLRRRLMDGGALVSLKDAERACAPLSGPTKKQFCIDDVLATNDLELAADRFYYY